MNKNISDDSLTLPRHFIGDWRFKAVLLTVLISILGYFIFTLWAGWEHVVSAVRQVGFYGILAALFLSFVNFLLRFSRWQHFLKILGYSVPLFSSLRIFFSGFALTTTPGKTGEAIRGLFLKDYGVPYRKSIGAFFAERLSDLTAVTILALSGLWIYPETRPIIFIVLALILAILFIVQKNSWLKTIENGCRRLLPERFSHSISFLIETVIAFRDCFRPSSISLAILLGVFAWCLEGLALYMLLQLLGYDISLMTSIFIYGFSLVIGGITLLPGGLGGAELTMLQLLMLQSVTAPDAVALTLVIRLTSLWFSVLLGFISLPKKQIWN